MLKELMRLANVLDERGLFEEADLCASLIRFAKGGDTQSEPYGSIASPMSPLAYKEDCDCSQYGNNERCPACGKLNG